MNIENVENEWVSLENAKLLKELGYDIPCKSRFPDNCDSLDNSCIGIEDTRSVFNWNSTEDSISIPEFKNIQCWLNDTYDVEIGICPSIADVESNFIWVCYSTYGRSEDENYNHAYNNELKNVLINLLKIKRYYE